MRRVSLIAVPVLVATVSLPAHAIPAFARKYATSCQTCHTLYPKLTPFGEAFRRNGFRFPGTDSDFWKQEVVTLTPKTGAGDATVLSVIPPLSFGGNGFAVLHPDKNTSGGLADNGTIGRSLGHAQHSSIGLKPLKSECRYGTHDDPDIL